VAERENKGLGARIKRLRLQAGLSQADLGDRLGVSYQQVQKYEGGRNRVSADTLVRLARVLSVPAASLLEAESAKGSAVAEPRPDYAVLSREERDLLKAWRDLAEDKVRAAFLTALKAASRKA
jgi:transcriptional regulator with XRE-family HTH domain